MKNCAWRAIVVVVVVVAIAVCRACAGWKEPQVSSTPCLVRFVFQCVCMYMCVCVCRCESLSLCLSLLWSDCLYRSVSACLSGAPSLPPSLLHFLMDIAARRRASLARAVWHHASDS